MGTPSIFDKAWPLPHYKAKVTRIIDGDTCVCEIDLGFAVIIKQTVRLMGINAPELKAESYEPALKAKQWLANRILDKEVRLTSNKFEKYGRVLGTIDIPGEEVSINHQMVHLGFAVKVTY